MLIRALSTKPLPRFAPRLVLGLTLLAVPLAAQQQQGSANLVAQREILAKEGYEVPPPELLKLATAPWHLNTLLSNLSPDRKFFMKEETESMQSMADYSRAHVWLGGLTIDPKASRARSLSTRGATGIQLTEATTGKVTRIDAPKGARIASTRWSPDGKQVAFIGNFDNASHVFVADIATGKPVQITTTPLLATAVTSIEWTPDGKGIVVTLPPDNRKAEPKAPEVAAGPKVALWTEGKKSNERFHFSLLEDPYQQELLEYYITSQLAVIDVKTKAVKKIGAPAMIKTVSVSPDGQYFRVTTVTKPFSYVVPYSSFGSLEQIWDVGGKALAEIERRPVQLESDTAAASARANAPGRKRALAWMPQGSGLYFLEAKPGARGGDSASSGRGAASRADRVSQWNPPFGASDTKVLYESDGPISDAVFSPDAKMLFIGSTANGTGEIFAVDLSAPTQKHSIVRGRGYTPAFAGGGGRGGGGAPGGGAAGAAADSAFYNNPGGLVTRRGSAGGTVAVVSSDGSVFLHGTRYFPNLTDNPPREFLDKVSIASGTKTRVFEGARETSDAVGTPLDDDYSQFIVNRESPREVAQSYLRDKTGTMTKLTSNKDYAPEFTSAIRKRLTATRADGVHFIVDLTLPANWQPGTRLPGMFWFYPGEYTDQGAYDRRYRTDNVNKFPTTGVRQTQYFVVQGYAVAEFNPPIIGAAGRMNDNYVADLRMNLAAVIDELDKGGYIDRSRLAIGGHSYGAFSTANALVNTPFFKAGIAGDGMYNRTLTPTGFQNERRNFWEASKTYLEMSPMLSVDKMQGALLMYHGLEDTNFGTHPISAIRMMQALRATGKTSALYMYPFEDHGPATRESDLDLWARWSAWLDIYVKHAGEKPAAVVP